jgi:SAM-dependent methyltransferase
VEYAELQALMKDEDALASEWSDETRTYPPRGVRLRRFKNGNAHLFFFKDELRDINMALAEYYGEVLCDEATEKPEKRQESTEVAKDLQYYPTPLNVISRMFWHVSVDDKRVLEPSCGTGNILDAIRANGGKAIGVEYDHGRAVEARSRGHNVIETNFLDMLPAPDRLFDVVMMNPPFYGKHYAKHVDHAMEFLKPGGKLIAVLPITARYDHDLLDGRWEDLPVGSFKDSGTNINTTILMKWKPNN